MPTRDEMTALMQDLFPRPKDAEMIPFPRRRKNEEEA